MNNNNNSSKLEKQQRFWEAYRGAAEENRVRTDLLAYYVKWAKAFADSVTRFFPARWRGGFPPWSRRSGPRSAPGITAIEPRPPTLTG